MAFRSRSRSRHSDKKHDCSDRKQDNCMAETITLHDKTAHPSVGFGTYKVGFVPASASSVTAGVAAPPEGAVVASECVKQALEVGYRFLDCAQFYGNEAEVGKGIAASGVPRSELFIASKVWTDKIYEGPEAVQAQIDKTLQDLGTDYLDLYCVHWPVPGKHVAAYLQLEKAMKAMKIRCLGISNYAVEDYKELMESATVKPVINQIEINPFLYRKNTIAFFESEGVRMQSYRGLRDGKAFHDPQVLKVATKHGKSAAQVLGRWVVQHGFIHIPKSVKVERMRENKELFDFSLDDEDMGILDNMTPPENIETFKGLYAKCVVRDTPDAGNLDLVRKELTVD